MVRLRQYNIGWIWKTLEKSKGYSACSSGMRVMLGFLGRVEDAASAADGRAVLPYARLRRAQSNAPRWWDLRRRGGLIRRDVGGFGAIITGDNFFHSVNFFGLDPKKYLTGFSNQKNSIARIKFIVMRTARRSTKKPELIFNSRFSFMRLPATPEPNARLENLHVIKREINFGDDSMNLSNLSDAELVTQLTKLSGNEREIVVKVLYHLIELEKRGFFRDLGYSSLFDYCTRALKYSQASAYRRIAAARCLRDNPEIGGLLLEGKVTLCSVTAAAKSIEKQVTAVTEIVGCSKREVESLVAKSDPVAKRPREVVKELVVKDNLSLFDSPADERVQIRFSLTKMDYARLEEVKAKLSNKLGHDLSTEAIVNKLVEIFLKPNRQASRLTSSETRYIPKAVKRAVIARDHGECCYVSLDGVKCNARSYLQFDHTVPFALGGKSELNNLRLLCPAHNQLMAEQQFGKELIRSFANYHR